MRLHSRCELPEKCYLFTECYFRTCCNRKPRIHSLLHDFTGKEMWRGLTNLGLPRCLETVSSPKRSKCTCTNAGTRTVHEVLTKLMIGDFNSTKNRRSSWNATLSPRRIDKAHYRQVCPRRVDKAHHWHLSDLEESTKPIIETLSVRIIDNAHHWQLLVHKESTKFIKATLSSRRLEKAHDEQLCVQEK